ncbi:hypothetical protein [Aneurinibacillus tyrosinisolvens]|uniref:hypothetical protein n=1 Tax=Aneurinibacillus tyrosinisolvens TaxID=1443435 RepID=UPI00063F4EA9|nr:hypothetical protein [Aneurinibacillus tyrosinisolvens]
MSRTKPFTSLTGLAGYTEEMIEWLALYGADPEGGVTRLLYTPSWVEAQRALERKMKETGLDVFYDDAGNLFGRLEAGSPGAGTIVTGMASYQQIENIKDAQGISFKEAMRAAGFGAGSHGVRRRDDIQAFS